MQLARPRPMSAGPRAQGGMSIITLMLFLASLGMVAYTALTVLPSYFEFWQIKKVLKNSTQSMDGSKLTPRAIRERFTREMSLNNLDKHESVNERSLVIKPTSGGGFDISLAYSVKKPYWNNISLCLDFKAEARAQ